MIDRWTALLAASNSPAALRANFTMYVIAAARIGWTDPEIGAAVRALVAAFDETERRLLDSADEAAR